MKHPLLLPFFLFSILAAAQELPKNAVVNSHTGDFFAYEFPWMKSFQGEKKIKSLSFREVVKNKPGTQYFFNEKGETIKMDRLEVLYYTDALRPLHISTIQRDFDHQGRLTEQKMYDKKGRLLFLNKYEYFTDDKLSFHYSEKKGRPDSKTIFVYNTDSTIAKSEYYRLKKSANKPYSCYVFTYYADKKTKSTQYFKRGKLEHTWNYDCDERGKIVKRDTTLICTKEGSDIKGRKVVTRHFTDTQKKKEKKTVWYYKTVSGKDVLNETEEFIIKNGKEIPSLKIHFADSTEPFYSRKTFTRKGKPEAEQTDEYYTYTSNDKKLKSNTSKGYNKKCKLEFSRIQSYNKDGLPLETEWGQNRKNVTRYIYTSDHSFTINHYRKLKLKRSYEAEIAYY